MDKKIRLATDMDASQILNIYKPYITDTVITFENKVPSVEEFKERMKNIQSKYPWFVCEIDGRIVGYAYASKFHERIAYEWSVDFSIYIEQSFHGKRIGKALYYALLNTLKMQGFCNAYAIITSPNVKSEAIHKSLGFKEMGTAKKSGYKMGKWLDVKWFELQFNEHKENPDAPISIDVAASKSEFEEIIKEAEKIIKY